MTLPAPIFELVVAAIEPQRIRDNYYCRCCGAITSSLQTLRLLEVHREDCPVHAAREWMEQHDPHRP